MKHESQIGYSSYGCAALIPPDDRLSMAIDDERDRLLDNPEDWAGELLDALSYDEEASKAIARIILSNLSLTGLSDSISIAHIAAAQAAEALAQDNIDPPPKPIKRPSHERELHMALSWLVELSENSITGTRNTDCMRHAQRVLRQTEHLAGGVAS